MASNEEKKPLNLCNEIFHHGSGRSITIPIDSNLIICESQQKTKVIFSKKISLSQEPYETLKLKLSTTFYFNICKLKLNLCFDNYLHEIRQDYAYAINLQTLGQGSESNLKHLKTIFYGDRKRTYNEIWVVMNIGSLADANELFLNVRYLCCCIRRFNTAREPASEASFSSNIGKMLLKHGSDYSDASLVVGDKIFSVHKLVLKSKSDVFKAMFTNDMSEAETGIVKIDDIDAEVIEEMLNYIYTGKTEKMSELSQELFQVANKYAIFDLREECEEYFAFDLNFENAVEILDLASVYEFESLRNNVMKFISTYEEDMVKQKRYQDFLCRDFTVDRIVPILKLCVKYDLEDVKLKAFKFVQENKETFGVDKAFLDLLKSNPDLSICFITTLLLGIK